MYRNGSLLYSGITGTSFDNNANVIVLSIRVTGEPLAKEIVDTWLATEPSTEPRRVNFHRKTDEVDERYRSRS